MSTSNSRRIIFNWTKRNFQLAEKTIIDEIQRAPEIFTSIKVSVDKNRKPGRFILTGSANVLLLPKLSDSLAGRIEIIGRQSSVLQNLFTSKTEPYAKTTGYCSKTIKFHTKY